MFGYTLVRTEWLEDVLHRMYMAEAKSDRNEAAVHAAEWIGAAFNRKMLEVETKHAEEVSALKAKYADELQRRMELAELVKKMEAEHDD